MNVDDAHVAEPGIDFDLDYLHRARNAGADRKVGEAPHHPAEDHAHEAGLLERRLDARRHLPGVFRPHAGSGEIGRCREHFAPWRVGAGDRLPLCILPDRGLQLLDRQQHRRDHRSRDPAAARARSFRQF